MLSILEDLPDILTNEKDVYNSRYVNLEANSTKIQDPQDTTVFKLLLKNTITHFEAKEVKGFFLTLNMSIFSCHLQTLLDLEFSFHNASGLMATLVKFIPKNRKNRLPGYASHYVGVGGLVLDFQSEKILVIKEKGGHDVDGWKVPGGLVDRGEYLADAVEREVFEETGKPLTLPPLKLNKLRHPNGIQRYHRSQRKTSLPLRLQRSLLHLSANPEKLRNKPMSR